MDTSIDLDQLAHHLADHGVEASEHLLARVVRAGRDTGAPPVAVAVLADRHEPGPVRVRAFLKVARRLSAAPASPAEPLTSAAPAVAPNAA